MNKYIKSLDGIRGLGIVFVMLYHFIRLDGYDSTIIGFSWIWIQMFFVQSGFLITQILLNSKEAPLDLYLKRFYWRRALRIFPIYFAYLLVFAITYLLLKQPHDFAEKAPYLFTYTYNFTRLMPDIEFNSVFFMHFWSLAVEEQFYLVWPFVIFFLSEKNLKRLIVFLIFAGPVFRFFLADYLVRHGFDNTMIGEIVYAFTLSQFDAFAFGAAIPVFKLQEKIKNPFKVTLFAIVISLFIGIVNVLSIRSIDIHYSITSLGYSVGETLNYQHVWSYTVINVLFTSVILMLIKRDYTGLFNNAAFVAVGKIVYGMYIIHFVILLFAIKLNNKIIHNLGISFAIAFLLTFALAYISYNYFERRFLSLKDLKFSLSKSSLSSDK